MADALVRPAGLDDAPTLARLQLDVWQQAYSELLPTAALFADPDQQSQIWENRVRAAGVLIAFEGLRPVGLAATDTELDDDGAGQLELLHVLPSW